MVLVVLVALRPARRRAKRQAAEFANASRSLYPFRPTTGNTTCRSATSSTSRPEIYRPRIFLTAFTNAAASASVPMVMRRYALTSGALNQRTSIF
jgi:hypothetical protein